MTEKTFPVEAGHVMLFARSIGDENPAYTGEDATAPPTFLMAGAQFDPDYPLRPRPGKPWLGSGATPSGLSRGGRSRDPAEEDGPKKKGPAANVLHAEQRFEFVRPVRVGDVLTMTQRPGRTWEKEGRKGGKMVFTEAVTEFRDEAGELVATATSVGVTTGKVASEGTA